MKDSVRKMLIAATVAGMFGFMPTDAEAAMSTNGTPKSPEKLSGSGYQINHSADDESELALRYENYQTFEQNDLYSLDLDLTAAAYADRIMNIPNIGLGDDAAGASILSNYQSAIANEILLYNLDDESDPYVVTPGYYKLTFDPNVIGEGDGHVALQLDRNNVLRFNYDTATANSRLQNRDTFVEGMEPGELIPRTTAEYIDEVSGVFARLDRPGEGGVAIVNAGENAHIGSINGAQFLAYNASEVITENDGYDEYGYEINQRLISATSYNGGAIANEDGAVIGEIVDSTFAGGIAKEGVVLYNNASTVGTISGNTFISNNASAMGIKEIYRIMADDSIITYKTIDYDNMNKTYGGVISNVNNAVIDTIDNNIFVGYSAQRGGAISNREGSHIGTISNSTFLYAPHRNLTSGKTSFGGAIFNAAKVTRTNKVYDMETDTYNLVEEVIAPASTIDTIDNVRFLANRADMRGGAIENAGEIGELLNSEFNGNRAKEGGAISNNGTVTVISGTDFIGNKAIYEPAYDVALEMAKESTSNILQSAAPQGSVLGAVNINRGLRSLEDISCIAGAGGAISNKKGGVIESIENSRFIGNKATYKLDTLAEATISAENTNRDTEMAGATSMIRDQDMASENTTSAESSIRDEMDDDDMSGDMGDDELAQAGQSMLAQANQSNQGVLSLLGSGMKIRPASDDAVVSSSEKSQQPPQMSSRGGAIANVGTVGNITDSEFVKNAAEYGGAIYNSYDSSAFESLINRLENTYNNITYAEMASGAPEGTVLGAISLNKLSVDCAGVSSSIGNITSTRFDANNAFNGGAIYNGTHAQVLVVPVEVIEENYWAAEDGIRDADQASDLAQANQNSSAGLSLLGSGSVLGINAQAAAINIELLNPEINVTVGNITDSEFTNNLAVNGGAIMNGTTAYDSKAMQGIWVLLGSATPVLGQANGLTQASETPELTINATIGDITRTLFENNRAQTGGAIFNQGGENARLNDMATEAVYSDLQASAPMSLLGRQVDGLDQAEEMGDVLDDAENPNIDFDFDYEYVQDFASQDAKGYENGLDIDALFNTTVVANIGNIQNSQFRNNTADLYGGAIYNSNATIKGINNVLFEANQATAGGAICNNGTITEGISDSQFIGNTAAMSERVMDAQEDMWAQDNTVYSVLGMVAKQNPFLRYNSKMLQAASVAGNGGAVYNEASLEIRDSRFEGNEAEGLGGAIYNTGKAVLLDQAPLMESPIRDEEDADDFGNNGSSVLSMLGSCPDDEDLPIGVVDDEELLADEVLPDVLRVIGTEFVNNSAREGGAIFNDTLGTVELIEGCLFEGNTAVDGGAIASSGTINTINNTIFRNNTATGEEMRDISMADEMVKDNSGLSILGARVEEPAMVFGDGGAIRLQNGAAIMEMAQQQQLAEIMSGAPEMDEEAETVVRNVLTVNNSLFEGNSANRNGGAVYSEMIVNQLAEANQLSQGDLSVLGRYADDDMAGEKLAAPNVVYEMTFVNTSFLNNKAGNLGGAIYADHNVNIVADGANVVIKDNIAENHGDAARSILDQAAESMLAQANQLNQGGLSLLGDGTPELDENDDLPIGVVDDELEEVHLDPNAIFIDNANAKLTLEAKNGGNIYLHDNVRGVQGYKVEIKGSDINTDRVHLFNDLVNADVTMGNVALNTINNEIHTYAFDRLTLVNNVNMSVDVDLANQTMDRLTANSYELGENQINVAGMNLLSDLTGETATAKILFADNELKNNVTTSISTIGAGTGNTYQGIAYAPIFKYTVAYTAEENGGFFNFVRGVTDTRTPDEDEVEPLTPPVITPENPDPVEDPVTEPEVINTPTDVQPLIPSGGSAKSSPMTYHSFNPAVLSSSVSTQVSVAATQNVINNNAFHGIDMAVLRANERIAAKYANKYALGEEIIKTDLNTNNPLFIAPNHEEVWFKPYVTFENIPLKNGPKVHSINYGTMLGYDSNPRYHRHDWESVWTGYIGYTGSESHITGVSTNSNGGLIGLTYSLFKGNFFNATTVTAGAMLDQSSTMYGKDDVTTLYAGIGNKTGYNFQFKDGRFVLQPSLLLSYTFANTFDYTNSAGVKIDSNPMNTLQISPGLKFYMNTKKGWQPYIGVNMMWNVMGRTDVKANNVNLPRMSVKPYIQYGIGIQKVVKDNFTAYGEAMVQNGGRNGVSLTFGFKWAIGKNKK